MCEKHATLLMGPDSPHSNSGVPSPSRDGFSQNRIGRDTYERNSGVDGASSPGLPPDSLDGVVQIMVDGDGPPKDAAAARRMRRKTQFIDIK